jgi:MFS superfamily sulfate permease-like transporter
MSRVKSILDRLFAFIKAQKVVLTTTVLTALLLDVITGIIFGFGGAALFASI